MDIRIVNFVPSVPPVWVPIACVVAGVVWLLAVYHWDEVAALRFRLRPYVGAFVQITEKGTHANWVGKVSRVDRKFKQVYVDVEVGESRWMSNWFRFDQVRLVSVDKERESTNA